MFRTSFIKIRAFAEEHERLLSGSALLFGFIIDSLTLKRIDLLFENLVIVLYLSVAALCIVLLDLRETKMLAHRIGAGFVAVAPFVLQVAFGALFSAFVIFYVRSASLSASWPFIIFLLALLIGNESFRRRYHEELPFRIGIFFIALLSYAVFAIPTVLNSVGSVSFLVSLAVGTGVFSILIFGLSRVPKSHVRKAFSTIRLTVGGIVLALLVAYAANIIPPIPLALKDSAVAHQVVRTASNYILTVEPRSMIDRLRMKELFHRSAGIAGSVSVWTSVFAPTDLTTTIVHEWQYRKNGKWITASRIRFPIVGGADGGYRGYSTKENIFPGSWRVSVETEQGQIIGRVRFDIVDTKSPVALRTVVR